MSERPFHHGSLRTVLLDEAEKVLRERGVDALSLRELAREAGVSHGAPRSHFIDRKALLDALAERGFHRLASEMRGAADRESGDYAASLRACGHAYLNFAVQDAALLDLMFATKMDDPPESLLAAAEELFAATSHVMRSGVALGVFPEVGIDRLTILMSATMQGISTFVAARRVDVVEGDAMIDQAIAMFLRGASVESEPKA
jgi:AcrR family transcriptional regulator